RLRVPERRSGRVLRRRGTRRRPARRGRARRREGGRARERGIAALGVNPGPASTARYDDPGPGGPPGPPAGSRSPGDPAMPPRAVLVLPLAVLLAACGDEKKGGDGASTAGKAAPAGGYGYGYASRLGSETDKKVGDAIQKGKKWLLGKRDEATGAWGMA